MYWGLTASLGWLVVVFPLSAGAQVIISEIMYDLPGTDAKAEWVELQNTGTASVDVSKWKINDGSNHALNAPPKNGSIGSMTIAPGEYLILASDAAAFRAAHTMSVSVIDTTLSLGNNGDSISLLNGSGSAQDTVSYAKSTGGDGSGESLQKFDGVFGPAKPTPGGPNSNERLRKTTSTVTPGKISSQITGKIDAAAASTSTEELAQSDVPTSKTMAASAVVPINTGSHSYMPWVYGTLALGLAGASAVFVARQKKKDEWDIEEIA